MQARRRELFTTIRTEGAILPPDLLERIAAGDKDLGGLKPADYHLFEGEPLNEAIVRSWNRLVGAWAAFSEAREKLPDGDLGTTVTRERWLLILFDELGYGRLQPARAAEIDGKSYAASHAWGDHNPIHLVGCKVPLDRRSQGVAGAASMSPHGLVQELLNRSDERLWGFVSNGLTLRVLRDNSSLTRQAYVEFDLASMMDGDVYADFVVLWLVCHESRIEGDTPHECWLERWSQEAVKQGTRALDSLRAGVEAAISALGGGFLSHPANTELRDALRSGELDKQEYYRELLRLVYRLLFLFVAEDRCLLYDPNAAQEAAERYDRFYSTRRLRRLADRRRGSKHADLYQGLRLVMEKLGDDDGCPALGLPALGSYLWSADATPHLGSAEIPNTALLDAVRALATLEERGVRRAVDYRNLGAEELGSVYESLLELHPDLNVEPGTFSLTTAAGNERKTSGSYYTPTSLISCLLDSALDPVVEEAAANGEQAILDLKVCDPACGSGHFLVAAAHRIAKRLASARTGDEEPSPEATRTALRDVIGRCLYGVDANPMAVELCKVSLWMEALEPGKPLSFLDAHVKCGNSLFGTTLAFIEEGIPDSAFKSAEGDDKELAKALRKQNAAEREGQITLEDIASGLVGQLETDAAALEVERDDSVEELRAKERRYAELASSTAYVQTKLAGDAWCAAFVQRKNADSPRITTGLVRRIAFRGVVPEDVRGHVDSLANQFRFFHWEVEFPHAFGRNSGGFDVVIGNPPWDQLELNDREFFSGSAPTIAATRTMATRRRLIEELATEQPELFADFARARRYVDGLKRFIHASGLYPLTSFGRLNLAPLFTESGIRHTAARGRAGFIVPTSIATDAFNQHFFANIVDRRLLVSLMSFENEEFIFPGIHHATKFCLLTLDIGGSEQASFSFFARSVSDIYDKTRVFSLTAEDFALLNPNTKTCPTFRTARDAEIVKEIYRRTPILVREHGNASESAWGFRGILMFMMNTDGSTFTDGETLEREGFTLQGATYRDGTRRALPLYEGKMIHQFDHRFGTYTGQTREQANQGKLPELTDADHADPNTRALPRYWSPSTAVERVLRERATSQWLIAWRDITSSVVARTVISAVIPKVAANDSLPIATLTVRPELAACFVANLNSFAFDYVARQKIGGSHLRFYTMHQLPVLPPRAFDRQAQPVGGAWVDFIATRVLELSFTAGDLEAFAKDLGYEGEPFRWNVKRRATMRAELDGAFFHLYGFGEEDTNYVMETFPILKRRDEEKFGHYRTKALILDVYRKMADAIATGVPYETILDPPPADPSVAHTSGAELVAE